MNYPKISIITPSYNQGHFIEQTICSVLDQGYPNLEYIIVDGGSKDDTVGIIKKYERHLAFWVSEKDKGQSDAINKGFRKATGEVVNWLNSDDYYEPGSLFKVAAAFADPEVQVYCGISRIFGSEVSYLSQGTDVYPDNLEKTVGWARIDQPETFFRKKVWDDLGGIDERFHYLMDREFWMRYLYRYGLNGIRKTDDLLVHFRLHEDSKTVSQAPGFRAEGLDLLYSVCLASGNKKEADFLAAHYTVKQVPIHFKSGLVNDRSVIHYTLFYLLLAAYAGNDLQEFRLMSEIVDPRALSAEDRREYRKIMLRSRLPQGLKKWWNRR